MAAETLKTTSTVPRKSSHGCCRGEAAPETQNKASEQSTPAARELSEPAKAADSCCCGGGGKK